MKRSERAPMGPDEREAFIQAYDRLPVEVKRPLLAGMGIEVMYNAHFPSMRDAPFKVVDQLREGDLETLSKALVYAWLQAARRMPLNEGGSTSLPHDGGIKVSLLAIDAGGDAIVRVRFPDSWKARVTEALNPTDPEA